MKLELDHVRSILLFLEENLSVSSEDGFIGISYTDISIGTSVPEESVINAIYVLDEAGFIAKADDYGSDRINVLEVYRITYLGYQFLDEIRPKTVFEKTKSVLATLGTGGINFASQIASQVISEMIAASLSPPRFP